MKKRLTKRLIDTFSTERPQGEMIFDSEVPGLAVRVWKSGRKSFTLDYGPRDRRRRITIGKYGALTLDAARNEARLLLAEVHAGRDPLDERKAARRAHTFSQWVAEYRDIMRKEGRHGEAWQVEVRRYLGLAADRFGKLRLGNITALHVERFRDVVGERGQMASNRALQAVKACLGEAWRRELIPSNPAARVRALKREDPRQRVLTDEELASLRVAVESHSDAHFRAGMLWLLETGARRSEVLRAQWSDLDLSDPARATWRIPKPKNKKPITKPLPEHMAETLAALPRNSLYVLGRWGEKTPSAFNHEWRRLRKATNLPPDLKMHDIRRTYGLHAARAAGLHVASKLLGHSSVAITERVYSPLQDRDLRDAQEAVEASRAQILPFKRKTEGDK